MDGAVNLTPNGYAEFSVITFQNDNAQPFHLIGSVDKRMSSEPQSASISLTNPASIGEVNIIEQWLSDYYLRSTEFLESDFQLEIISGYSENGVAVWHQIFLGDIVDIGIPQAPTVSDMSITFDALGGNREMNRPRVKHVFDTGTSDLEIVEYIYGIWAQEWGTLRGVIADPDGKLAATIRRKPFTIDRDETNALNDIADLHDYVWGIDRNHFFCVPKNYIGEVTTDDKAAYRVDTSTGKVGISGLEKGRVAFNHLIDADIQLGRRYISDDTPSLDVPAMELRCDAISYTIDNTSPQPCNVSGFIIDGDVAKLPTKQSRVDHSMMR